MATNGFKPPSSKDQQKEIPTQEASKPVSQRSLHSKHSETGGEMKIAPEAVAYDPRENNPKATFSQNAKKFYGVESKCCNKGTDNRSEISSKASYKQDAGIFYGEPPGSK